ncbi:MAG: adenylyltransferase/cytidyltransferase family protein [Alphaproteobacteria bacterium]|nr:adenylyltransferase/cytidyltransferase family protein [Alphaproteobacteria bacterium]
MQKIGFYSGSFNPFTRGHMEVVAKGLQQMDRVIIGVGINPTKTVHSANTDAIIGSIKNCVEACAFNDIIRDTPSKACTEFAQKYSKNPEIVQVVPYTGTTVDAAHHMGCQYLIRGLRAGGTDDAYEQNLDAMNQLLCDTKRYNLQTVLIPTDGKHAHLSSSNARALAACGEFEALKSICYPSAVEYMAADYLRSKKLQPMPSVGYHNNTHVACMINWLNAAGAENMDFAASVHDAGPLQTVVKQYPDVANLILATDHTGECEQKCAWDRNACLFHDADLSILFSRNYGWYAYQVFCEYKDKYSVSEYAQGRIKVLEKLLTTDYKTDYFKRFQGDALRNINWEISYWQDRLKGHSH